MVHLKSQPSQPKPDGIPCNRVPLCCRSSVYTREKCEKLKIKIRKIGPTVPRITTISPKSPEPPPSNQQVAVNQLTLTVARYQLVPISVLRTALRKPKSPYSKTHLQKPSPNIRIPFLQVVRASPRTGAHKPNKPYPHQTKPDKKKTTLLYISPHPKNNNSVGSHDGNALR